MWCEPLGDAAGLARPPIHDPDPSRRVTQGRAPGSRSTEPKQTERQGTTWTATPSGGGILELHAQTTAGRGWPSDDSGHSEQAGRGGEEAIRLPDKSTLLHTSNPTRFPFLLTLNTTAVTKDQSKSHRNSEQGAGGVSE